MSISGAARDYITYARQLGANGNYSKAVDLYLKAFEKNPQLKNVFEQEFRTVMLKHNEILAAAERIEDIVANFGRAMNSFPDNIYLINETGRYLFKFGFYQEAWNQFQRALTADNGYVNAEKNLNSVKNLMVERWHFRMLNDKIRNDNYCAAIIKCVKPNKSRVLDIGTGTGLLSMYAAQRKPKSIIACDSSEVMTNLCDYILEENRLVLAVIVLNKMSTAMTLSDIEEKCTLLITELFDAGLFGEHILQSLSHAWDYLLSDNAVIIPNKAEFFIMGIDSKLLNSKYQLQANAKALLGIDHLNVHVLTYEESYDCEDVHFLKDIRYMTEPQSVIKVDFNDVYDVNYKLNNQEPYSVELKARDTGKINAYVGWFNLYLTENITITTDPRAKDRANAWQQAVFFDRVPRNVQENDKFTVQFCLKGDKLSMKSDDYITRISTETLRFLNDSAYLDMIRNSIPTTCVYLGQIMEISEVNVIDFSPFPLFGMLMLKRGIKSLICYARNDNEREFIEIVFGANHMDMSNVTILVGDNWSLESFGTEKFHVIFVNVFELCGEIDLRFREIATYLKNNTMAPGALVMPIKATLMGQIVNCPWLDITNRAYDKNMGCKVANHINKFQVSQNINLVYTNLEYTPLTDPIVLGNCCKLTAEVMNIPITNDGNANAILCWYVIELIENLGEVSTANAFSFIDNVAFLANPPIPMVKGNVANVLRCVDTDGSFKLIIDNENT